MKILFTNLLLFVGHFWIQSQHLTISTSGQTGTSGTNWSITGNTLNIASSGSAHINTSVITNHLTNIGDLTIVLPHNGVNSRDLYINNSITYTGSSARTLTFNITNDIIFASNMGISSSNASLNLVFRTALTLTNIDHGRIALNQSTINTNGGHLWMGGGPTTATWNGLTVGNSMARTWADNIAGISIINSTIITNGGHIYMYGRSHNSSDDFGSSNFGVNIENSSISSTSGSITIYGDVLGRYTNGIGTRISSTSSTTTISATSGSINIGGWGSDQTTNGNGWRLGTSISGSSSTVKTIISSVSGNVQIEGNAGFAATINDKEGFVIGGATEIISRSGNISLKGTNALESSGQYCNSIRFDPSNVSNSIRVGFDGTNSYTGNILIEGNSIYQRYLHSSAGSIAVQTTGTLTIQPTGTAFTYMRADNAGTLTYDNDWNFGTNLGGFVYGKTTNTSALTYNNSLRTNGPMTFYTGSTQLGVGVEMTADGANGHINFLSSNGFGTVANSGSTRGKIMATGGGSININADSDNNNSGTLDIDWLTIDGTSGNVLLECAAFVWNTASQVALPEFYSNGGALTIRNTTSSNYDINTIWFAMFGNFGGITLGREGGTGAILLNSCTNCSSSALNFGTTAFQVAGPITALGGNIYANINLRSTNSGSDILLKADKHIVVGANVGVQSNNGDITFWSNSNGVADPTDGDFIGIYSGVSINSANGLTNQTTGGGTITIAGGNTSQVLPSGTVVPTAYAYSSRTTNWIDPVLPPGGVNFGEKRSAVGGLNTVNIYSGGGNIVIKGKSSSSSAGIQWLSGPAGATQVINSGNGTVTIDGLSTSSTAHGIEFMSYASVVSPTIISSNTSSSAIRIIGETFSTNNRAGYLGTVKLEANGTGGGIEVNGKVASSSNYAAIEAGTLNAYALSGPITFISEGGLGLKAGGVWGKGTLASSSSNITLKSDNISLYTATIETTGTLTVESIGTSFASALTFPITNLTVGNTVSGLTLGKSTNTANITLANATTIAGPITAYGGNIFAQQNLTSTLSGAAILLQATGYIDVSASDIIQTSNGNITLRANASGTANTTTSAITLNSGSSLLSNGGNITLGGNFSGTQGAGLYAASARVNGSPGILINNATISAAGGNINIYGRCSTSYDDGIRLQANINTTGAGSIGIYGDAFGGYNGTQYFGGISFFNEVSRIEAVSGNVTLEGILTNSQSSEGYAINFYRSSGLTGQIKHIQILSQTGDIQITADRGSSIGGGIGHSSWGHIYFGSPSNNLYTASGDIKFTYSNLIQAANNGFKVKTTGAVTYEPVANSFITAQTLPINSNYVLAENASRLTIGKTNNLANITIASAQTIAGPIEISGGTLAINANLTSTATTDTGITLNGQNIIQNSGIAVTTSGANINYLASGFSSTSGVDNAIKIGDVSGARASINAGGGNISLTGSFGTTSTAGSTDFGIWLFSTDVITSGTGSITLTGNATNTLSTSSAYGISMGNATVKTASGAITLNGTGGKASTNSRGIVADQYSNKIISASGAITFNEIKPTGLTGTYTGFFMRPTTTVNTFIGADGSEVSSSSSSVTIKGDRASFETNGTFRNNINTSGAIVFESVANTFEADPSLTGLTISGNPSSVRIGKTTNTANITLGSAVTAAGPISVYGGNIDINNNLTSTANNAKILIKASGQINTNNTRTFQTNNGDFILWSDADNSNGGRIWLGLNNTINTANGSISNGLSGGGKIVLAGGLDNGANGGTANDDIPDGFASNNSSIGVYLGNTSSNYTQMYSGGGDILIKGASTFASATNDGTGLWSDGRWLANSGKGAISIHGTSTHFFGINFSAPLNNISSGNKHIEFVSDKSTGNAVEVTGSSNASYGVVFNYENPKEVLATGGGAITITGTGGALQGIFLQNTDILSTSGSITMNGGSNGIRVASSGVRIGSRLSTAITSSTSNIKWTANSLDLINLSSGFSNNFSTSGNVTIEPFSNSFTNAISYPITNLSVENTVSGLTLGKSTNTANITFGSTTSIAGPITAFGGTIAVNENIASSNGSTISLYGNALTFGTNKTVASSGQLVVAPQTASNSIGLGGAAGTLAIPASYFSTNFADGFSNIQIGSNSQTGNIAANTFTLRDNVTVLTTGSLTLGGKPILGNNNVTLGSAISSISGTPTHYFQTNGTGTVKRSIGNNANLLFPIGNTSYNPITITNKTGTADTFSISILDTAYLNGSSTGNITSPYVKRTWNISKNTPTSNAGSGVDFTFQWNANEVVGTLTNPTLNHHNGSGWNIPTMGTTSVSGNSLTYTGYKGSFSPFAIGGSNVGALPIELKSFNTACQSDYVQVDWTTASEKNNKMFELYKSDNAVDWSLIHTTDGQGDKASETNYQFMDNDKKLAYYRLKDIDFDGIENWSQIIFADCKNESTQIEVYPNPATEFIKVILPYEENTTLNILSMEGKILKTLPLVSKNNLINIKDLTVGIYLMELSNKTLNKRIRFVKK
jgi:hypothetical protein